MGLNITYRKISTANIAKITKDYYENEQWQLNNLVCGIDEVGRGCLAGPVVVAAVILQPFNKLKNLKDSKLLAKEELLKVYPRIAQNSWYSFGIINNLDIDHLNIWQATIAASKQAIMNLFSTIPKLPSTILIDALPLNLQNTQYQDIQIYSFPKAENLSRTVAVASIIAKVKRDQLMELYDKSLSGYHFAKHKGYATPEHQNSLKINGQSILHRKTYLKNFEHLINEKDLNKQISLF